VWSKLQVDFSIMKSGTAGEFSEKRALLNLQQPEAKRPLGTPQGLARGKSPSVNFRGRKPFQKHITFRIGAFGRRSDRRP
jgi:hypothetical protein